MIRRSSQKQHSILASLLVGLVGFTLSNPAEAMTVSATVTPAEIGQNGTDDDTDGGAVYEALLTNTAALNTLRVDWSDLGIGEGQGVDLSNVDAGDVQLFRNSNGNEIGVAGLTVDNVNKVIEFVPVVLITLGTDLRIVVRDVQNPACPGSGQLLVESDGLILNDSGTDGVTFTGGRIDADGDGLPDGYEIYYGRGTTDPGDPMRGDEDDNDGVADKNAGLDPDVASDPLADFDNDGWSDRREFLGCSSPGDSNSTPSDVDSDGDNILDIDEDFPGETIDTDEDTIEDSADDDSDGDGILDIDEAGDADPMTPPVDSDGDTIPDFQDPDSDNDEVPDNIDNCPTVSNPDQINTDAELENGDELGDACDDDTDGDGVLDDAPDNCPLVPNPGQEDADNDGVGDACQGDEDGDNVPDEDDNCIGIANPNQEDLDSDGIGDACDDDRDGDGLVDASDNCPGVFNPTQDDIDLDGEGNVCDSDVDGDTVPNNTDNCRLIPNLDQADSDSDGVGDACEGDFDSDSVPDPNDNCPDIYNPNQADNDGDGIGDVCDDDDDGDGVPDPQDNCIVTVNPGQEDQDQDGAGDVCDGDSDDDGTPDPDDNCRLVPNPGQEDTDADGQGDACDSDDDNDGISDPLDPCPFDPFDGCGDDQDGDDVPDDIDNCPRVPNRDQLDSDGDGAGDACDSPPQVQGGLYYQGGGCDTSGTRGGTSALVLLLGALVLLWRRRLGSGKQRS